MSPIRENEGLNDSHEFVIEHNININMDQQLLAKSCQTQKDWKKLDEFERMQEKLKDKSSKRISLK